MKITDIETILLCYRYEETEKWKWSGGETKQRNCILVKVTVDDKYTGLGEIGESAYLPRAVEAMIETRFKPMLLGEDPFNIEKIWRKMYIQSCHYGRKGVISTVISGIDIALYDVIGKILERPVYDLIGGKYRTKFKVYASGGMSKSIENLAKEGLSYVEKGYFGFKVRIGNEDIEEDISLIKELRNKVGTGPSILVDAGQCYTNFPWTYDTAIQVCKKLEECNLFWLEEPLHPDDIDGFKRLNANTTIPIVAGENEFTRYGFLELIRNHCVDIIQPDVTRSGGISECKRIAAIASAYHMRMAPHIFGSGVGFMANMHFMASEPDAFVMEHDQTLNPLREELLIRPITYKDGYVNLIEDLPGLGVELKEETVKKYAYNDIDAVEKGNFVPVY
ncbi:mandelate racemase/muconate lactonizing enzyme family protein [Clostridium sp. C105KSO13]|uniref:mandelate racemase/muconate lactonizing enzyme family protein n=1 Tax=Clostridium sp. C105KSO13 TaxID=1776045 RepID=UPI0007406854|nr:mandelate racemase/muconate lactonizing enzyme family protein [Clostridium sp. C105KSO13]CUX38672.1 L-rhamnonate dehydratase [Clostridium sp. C105KSO13]